MFNGIFLIFFEGYIEILLSSYLNLCKYMVYTASDMFSLGFAIACTFICIVILPITIINIICKPKELLANEHFETMYGSAYEGLRIKSKFALFNQLLYVLRRLFLLLTAFLTIFVEKPWMQLISMYFSNYLILIYIASCRPFEKNSKNNIEILNEYCIVTCSMFLMLFTDFIPDPEGQSYVGWAMVFYTVSIIGCNIFVIIKTLF